MLEANSMKQGIQKIQSYQKARRWKNISMKKEIQKINGYQKALRWINNSMK
jgi:hypothetical protein